ncbi:MAG: transglycosylase SLT domain-containing protein [Candidatus Aminicenantes bacterium]|nr:MAG: transglycosylase SLT domain-containing protein [Candidatus Aminicenantes bacterium]
MKKRDVIFFVALVCVIIGVAIFFHGKTTTKTEIMFSDLSPLVDYENPKNSQQQAEEQDFRNRLRERLQLSQDIIEEHTYDLPDMIKKRRIRVLTTYTFGNYFVYEGKAYGYEYSLMEEYKKFLNKGRKRADHVDFYYFPVPYELLVSTINSGYGDIVAANMTILQERSEEVDFTDPYQWNIKEVLVSNEGIEGIQKIEDLSSREVHVREGSSYHYSLARLNEQLKENKLAPIKIVALPGVVNTGEIIELVSSDVIDITVADSHIASIADELLPNIKVHEQIVFNDDVKFGWIVRKSNPQLKASLNQFIKTIKKGTYLGNIYFQRYFKRNPWAREGLKRDDFTKFSKYAPLFKKYGEMYGVDWMLVEAQAFQESGLNPDVRSRAGAVGLMQLLPSTAEWMGFDEHLSPENNVHAGVKYLKYLMDQYFPEDKYSATERLRLALAAYNAGPGNMQKSIRKTAELGYDATKWFGNVEMGTMRQVGLEPVHYVRNINKYYLSFLISDILEGVKEEIRQKRLNELRRKN